MRRSSVEGAVRSKHAFGQLKLDLVFLAINVLHDPSNLRRQVVDDLRFQSELPPSSVRWHLDQALTKLDRTGDFAPLISGGKVSTYPTQNIRASS